MKRAYIRLVWSTKWSWVLLHFSRFPSVILFAGRPLRNMEQVSQDAPDAPQEVPVGESSPGDAEDVPVSKEATPVADGAVVGDEAGETPKDEQVCSSDDSDQDARRVGVQLRSALCKIRYRATFSWVEDAWLSMCTSFVLASNTCKDRSIHFFCLVYSCSLTGLFVGSNQWMRSECKLFFHT